MGTKVQKVAAYFRMQGGKRIPVKGYTRTVTHFSSNEEASAWAQGYQGEWANKTRSVDLDSTGLAIIDYSSTGHQFVNGLLRGDLPKAVKEWNDEAGYAGTDDDSYTLPKAKKNAASLQKKLDEAFASVPPIPEDVVVYRGTEPTGDLQVGQEYTDPGYVSTSLLRDQAQDFASTDHDLAEITVPKGTKAIYVDALRSPSPSRIYENEMLLNRGLRYRVTSTNPLRMEVIP